MFCACIPVKESKISKRKPLRLLTLERNGDPLESNQDSWAIVVSFAVHKCAVYPLARPYSFADAPKRSVIVIAKRQIDAPPLRQNPPYLIVRRGGEIILRWVNYTTNTLQIHYKI